MMTRTQSLLVLAIVFACCGCDQGSVTATPPASGTSGNTAGAVKASPTGFSLETYKDKNALLIIFGDNRDSVLSQIAESQAFVDQHSVVIIEVRDLSSSFPAANVYQGEQLSREAASNLMDIFGPSPTGVTAVLVGKDGRIASRESGSPKLAEMFGKLP